MVTSRQKAGEYVHRIHPSLKSFINLTFSYLNIDKLTDICDIVFVSVPHGKSNKIVNDLYKRGIKIIDLSADLIPVVTIHLNEYHRMTLRLLSA